MPIYINWVSEIQNDRKRRIALATTYPFFLVLNVAVYVLSWAIHVLLAAIALPFFLWRSPRLLHKSYKLRWLYAKPRGERDWVSEFLDQYAKEGR